MRAFLPEPAGRLEPVEIGHPKIHQDHVRLIMDRHPHGVIASVHDPDDAEVAFLVERDLQRLPERAVIVGDDDSDGIVQRERVAVRSGAGHLRMVGRGVRPSV